MKPRLAKKDNNFLVDINIKQNKYETEAREKSKKLFGGQYINLKQYETEAGEKGQQLSGRY